MTKYLRLRADLALLASGTPTFATLADQIAEDRDLSPTRRRDMLSGIARVAQALGSPTTDIPCNGRWLQPRLARITPAQLGVTPKTWANSLSNLRSAMAHAGLVEHRKRRVGDLSPEWRALWTQVLEAKDPTVAPAARRFVFFLSAMGVLPEDVSQADAEAFREALIRNEVSKDPDTAWRMAINGWNLAGQRFPDWPRIRLHLPDRRRTILMPEATYPAGFIQELDALIGRLAAPDLLSEAAGARPLSAATRKQYRRQILRFAATLVQAGMAAEEIMGLGVLIDPPIAERGLRQMLARNGNQTSRTIADMAGLLRNLARLLDAPEPQRAALKLLAKKLALPPQKGMTEKNRARLRILQDPAQQRRLLNMPDDIFARPVRATRRYSDLLAREDALATALLLACPLRIKNLAEIDLDRHLQRPGKGSVFLVIQSTETKGGRPIEFELPEGVVALLDAHLTSRAPELCPPATRFLFPKRCGTDSIDPNALSARIAKRLRKELGIEMNAHLFRHFAVMLWLDANPGGYEVARRLLGHKELSHTINMYSGLEAKSASRAFADLVGSLREGKQWP
ncbi:site-specific integrase [Salibaculum sp.]|uniref:site-specific integrase n=1 Tax=Salibaculum sp. TaxID=2855480 RepID=UPI002B487B6D|nr:site-specific integrase [Salibaculum sp.]HKL70987.1 site-specific integrase [Salibaculum sp.]